MLQPKSRNRTREHQHSNDERQQGATVRVHPRTPATWALVDLATGGRVVAFFDDVYNRKCPTPAIIEHLEHVLDKKKVRESACASRRNRHFSKELRDEHYCRTRAP